MPTPSPSPAHGEGRRAPPALTARLSLQQAESQINKQTKGEGLRKPERPSLHLRIPVPPGAQPVYISRDRKSVV